MRIWLVHSRTKGCEAGPYPVSIHWTKSMAVKVAARRIAERKDFIERLMPKALPIHYFVSQYRLRL